MKKQQALSILFKLCALLSFGGLLGGGGYLAYDNFTRENWPIFGVGCGMLALGLFFTALFVTLFSRLDRQEDFADKPLSHCFKGAGLFAFIALFILFFGFGVYLWADRGLWEIGVASIVCFVAMIALSLVVSFFYQMEPMKKLRKDAQAIEMRGTVKSVGSKWTIFILKPIPLIWKFSVEINGSTSTAYCSWRDPLLKRLRCGDEALVKIRPDDPHYCLLLTKNTMPREETAENGRTL